MSNDAGNPNSVGGKKQSHHKNRFRHSLTKSITSLFSGQNSRTANEENLESPTAENQDLFPRRSTHDSSFRNSISEGSSYISSRLADFEFENNIRSLIADTEDKEKLPILLPSDSNEYMFEGYVHKQDIEIGKDDDLSIEDEEIIQTNKAYVNYSKYFNGKEHFNFVGRYSTVQSESNVFSISLKFEDYKIQSIFRTKDGNKHDEIELKEIYGISNESVDIENIHILNIVKKLNPNFLFQEVKPINHPIASSLIQGYDNNLVKSTFTFGIIYQKFGQVNEKEIFDNTENSNDFDEFLNFIGRRVTLKNFAGFRGMLDTNNDDTGKESVYEQHDDSEIMFHVSTLLPFSNQDQQHVERKRHIGNDRVAIVFQDKDTPFSPRMIKSKLLHVFMIIQPVKINNETKFYKVSVISKKDVPCFGPIIRTPSIFNKDANLKKFLLSKLINAEFASLRAPAFCHFSEQTIKPALNKLCSRLNQLTYNFSWVSDPVLYNFGYVYLNGPKISQNSSDLVEATFSVIPSPQLTSNSNKIFPKPVKNALKRLSDLIREPIDINKEEEKDEEFKLNIKYRESKSRKNSRLEGNFDNLSLSPSVEAPTLSAFEESSQHQMEKSEILSLPNFPESRKISLDDHEREGSIKEEDPNELELDKIEISIKVKPGEKSN